MCLPFYKVGELHLLRSKLLRPNISSHEKVFLKCELLLIILQIKLQVLLSMGNCMETTAALGPQGRGAERDGLGNGDASGKQDTVQVKVVLTRKELQWLMLQLKEGRERRLQDVLKEMRREMERERGKSKGWMPDLESISETPDAQSPSKVA